MLSKPKGRQKKAQNVDGKTFTKTRMRTKRLKQAGPNLSQAIELANLAPRDAVLPLIDDMRLPSREELDVMVASLPPKLAEYLTTDANRYYDPNYPSIRYSRLLWAYDKVLRARATLREMVQLVKNEEVGYLRECLNCGDLFFAGRANQRYCPKRECTAKAKGERQKKWQAEYEKKHGQPYRPKTREPRRIAKMKERLAAWKGPFEPTNGKMKDLAALLDITLKQCQADYEVIANEKRADPARVQR